MALDFMYVFCPYCGHRTSKDTLARLVCTNCGSVYGNASGLSGVDSTGGTITGSSTSTKGKTKDSTR